MTTTAKEILLAMRNSPFGRALAPLGFVPSYHPVLGCEFLKDGRGQFWTIPATFEVPAEVVITHVRRPSLTRHVSVAGMVDLAKHFRSP